MSRFHPTVTPLHRDTLLRIECEAEGGSHGRHRLVAHHGAHWVHSELYDYGRWMGHCCGRLLVDDFIAEAERRSIPCRAIDEAKALDDALPVAPSEIQRSRL